MQGKEVLITGGTAGIGRAAATALAGLGASVTIIGRDAQRCTTVAEEIGREASSSSMAGLACELSSLKAVRQAAEQFRAGHSRLDVLILNAGAFPPRREVSEDGFEKTFAMKFLGQFLLIQLLLPLLQASGDARIVVTGAAPGPFKVDFGDLNLEKTYRLAKGQLQSMSARVMLCLDLARRYEGRGLTANFMHPGYVNTGLFSQMPWIFAP
jgi:NAD(P)-dependent dehydrogenase (short-subunit alcohol dehydrogenase family)